MGSADGCLFHAMLPNTSLAQSCLESQASGWVLFLLQLGTCSGMRIGDALARKDSPPSIIDDVVSGYVNHVHASDSFSSSSSDNANSNNSSIKALFLQYTSRLNLSQRKAINHILSIVNTDSNSHIDCEANDRYRYIGQSIDDGNIDMNSRNDYAIPIVPRIQLIKGPPGM